MSHKPAKSRQQLLIAIMVFIACLAVVALISRQIISRKGQFLLQVIDNSRYSAEQSGEALLLLNDAENQFQSAILTHQPGQLTLYKEKLQQAFIKIDSIASYKADTRFLTNEKQRQEINSLYVQKLELSQHIFALRNSFDSLLQAADGFSGRASGNKLIDSIAKVARKRTAAELAKEDTVKVEAEVTTQKKGFFKKLKAAFSGGADTIRNGGGTIVNRMSEKSYRDSVNRTVYLSADASFQQLLRTLKLRQSQLSGAQTQLITTNMMAMEQLKLLVVRLQNHSQSLADELHTIALNEYRSTSTLLDNMGILSLLLVFLFALLLVKYISRIRLAEQQVLTEYNQALTLAQQKTDLLATMSHEIRNPLNSIIGFLNEFGKSGLTEKQSEMLASVQLSSDMLLGTVTDVLDMSKLESGKFQLQTEQFNPYHTIRLTTESMRFNAHQKKLLLNYHFTGDKTAILSGDAFRLKQILINLISNAIKYTKEGSVTIKAVLNTTGSKPVLEVTVADTGIGIHPTQQSRLFTKYYQTSSSQGATGTGLGLYICYRLIQLQQGNIEVESDLNKGTSIIFSIPYTATAHRGEMKEPKEQAVDYSVFAGKKLLIVDDNELNLKLISIMTQRWDVTLFTAGNGKDALAVLEKEAIDLVVTDMEMAEMNGAELVAAIINSKHANIPVVLSTAYHYTESETKALLESGFTGILTKPFNEAILASHLFRALMSPGARYALI